MSKEKKGMYKLDGRVVSEEEYYEAVKPENIFNITHDYDYEEEYENYDMDEYYDVYDEIYNDDDYYRDMEEAEEAFLEEEDDFAGFLTLMCMEYEDY